MQGEGRKMGVMLLILAQELHCYSLVRHVRFYLSGITEFAAICHVPLRRPYRHTYVTNHHINSLLLVVCICDAVCNVINTNKYATFILKSLTYLMFDTFNTIHYFHKNISMCT